jgi:hypothetical protein
MRDARLCIHHIVQSEQRQFHGQRHKSHFHHRNTVFQPASERDWFVHAQWKLQRKCDGCVWNDHFNDVSGESERAHSAGEREQQYNFGHVDFDWSAIGMHRLWELHDNKDMKKAAYVPFPSDV